MLSDDVDFEILVQVLHVVGYEFANETILLRLTLDGHRLETERIFAKTDKVFVNTNVSWSAKKGDIKRMKAENLPIRAECFRVRDRGHLEAIGYVLIPLRTIPTCLYKNDEILPSPRWFKLMGVPSDVLHNKPELHLNVIIQPEQECLSATHLRGKFDEDDVDDASFAEPPIDHFELKMTDEEEPEEANQNLPTPRIEVQQQSVAQRPPSAKETVVAKDPQVQKLEAPKPVEKPIMKRDTEVIPLTTEPAVDPETYKRKLEEWKNEEKENFLANLKKVENTFLESMFEEWQRKKHEEENKLQWTIEECERLSKKLEEGYAQMKDFQRTETDMQSRNAAADHAALQEELAMERKRNITLEMELREERQENKSLRDRIRQLEKQNTAMDCEMAEQIKTLEASMVKLKLSKDYYKQKWLQLIREVNKLNPDDS